MPVDTTRKPAAPARKATSAKPESLASVREKGLMGWAQIGQLACMWRGYLTDVGAISMHAPGICHEVAVMAEDNEQIAKGVDTLVAAGPYTALIASVLPLVVQLGVNHKRLPESVAGADGILPPDVLENQVKLNIERAKMEAAIAANQAREEMEEMQRRFQTANA